MKLATVFYLFLGGPQRVFICYLVAFCLHLLILDSESFHDHLTLLLSSIVTFSQILDWNVSFFTSILPFVRLQS